MHEVNDNGISSVMNIGFDMIVGPMLRWRKEFEKVDFLEMDYDKFAMSMYLAFKGGNDGGPRPRAIMYDRFSVVGFSKGMDLVCLLLKNREALNDMVMLRSLADTVFSEMEKENTCGGEEDEGDTVESPGTGVNDATAGTGSDLDIEETKRIVCNLLRGTTMSTPELRRCFELTNSSIWKVMSELERDGVVKRAGKEGRAVLWTLA